MDMEINFPNLGIYLDHVGKNISIFGFSIAYYGIVIVTGMMIAIWIAQREAKRTGQNPERTGSKKQCATITGLRCWMKQKHL